MRPTPRRPTPNPQRGRSLLHTDFCKSPFRRQSASRWPDRMPLATIAIWDFCKGLCAGDDCVQRQHGAARVGSQCGDVRHWRGVSRETRASAVRQVALDGDAAGVVRVFRVSRRRGCG